ncbi:MAG: hypothetical protein E7263_02890 [Lachnospiraceae bacterium]|nr:hypothetical protein [Lachnospiraceae bacterium]
MKRKMKRFSAIILSFVMVLSLLVIAPVNASAKEFAGEIIPTVRYKVHRQTYGWEKDWKADGQSSGTVGEGKRLESIKIELDTYGYDLGIKYRTHIQSFGWEKEWRTNGQLSGTEGKAKRLEAIQIELTGADAEMFNVYYRVHAQSYGWMGWAKNGEYAGTASQGKRLEAIEIVIVPAWYSLSDMGYQGSLGCAFVDVAKTSSTPGTGMVSYMTHVQSYGDQKWVADGSVAGTFGEAKRLEQISIKVDNSKLGGYTGGITYKTHVQSYGWMDWVSNGAKSGTSGQGKRLEGIKIKLTGTLATHYDVYYRVHAQSYGWLGWAKNGEASGTEGYAKRLEAIQVVVVPKGTEAPNNLPAAAGASPFVSKTGGCSDKVVADDTLYIYSWNDEFEQRMNYFYEKYPQYADKVACINLDLSGTGEEYPNKIKQLYKQGGDTVPSLVVADADVLHNFVEEHDFYVPMSDLGITAGDYANAYAYTVDYATIDNKLMALTWQATPGVVAYRTDIAQKVLGTSDPAKVQAAIADWDKFYETAEKMSAAGYSMVSGPDEIKFAYMAQRTSPWVIDGALNIDPVVYEMIRYSSALDISEFTNGADMWSSDWVEGMSGNVFCYFGCTWFIPWSLNIEDTPAYGKYRVVEGPAPFFWGGSYVLATDACKDKELAKTILKTLCCDEKVMYDIFADNLDYPNNTKAVQNLIKDGKGGLAKLGGQDPLSVYDAVAKKIKVDYAAPYDNYYCGYVDMANMNYIDDETLSWHDAIISIRDQVDASFPDVDAYPDAINVYSWNDEVGTKLDDMYYFHPEYIGLVNFVNLDKAGTSEDYMKAVDAAYKKGGDATPGIVAADADVLHKFIDEYNYYAPMSEVGITADKEYANAYDYTVDYATVDGELMALTWQATPGVVAYRTDIAKAVLGSSDPATVQAAIADWDKFMDTADKMKDAGYAMVAGPDEIRFAVLNSNVSPWVKDGALSIDDNTYNLLLLSKQLAEAGYTKDAVKWSNEWSEGMTTDVFCYFGCTWFVPWTLAIEDTAVHGKYNVVPGPTNYFWSGSYLMATDAGLKSDVTEGVLEALCCNESMMEGYYWSYDFPNNKKSVENLISYGDDLGMEKLGGQNPLPVYDQVAKNIQISGVAPDQTTYGYYVEAACQWYNEGTVNTINEAIGYIKEQVSESHPNITITD